MGWSLFVSEPTQGLWHNMNRPLAAILLGVLPFWLFLGASDKRTVNGEVVFESQLNLLGIVMAIIALGLAFTMLRRDGSPGQPPRRWLRSAVVIAAIPLALFQLGYSIGFYSFKDIKIALFGGPAPPPATYSGLNPDLKKFLVERSRTLDQGRLNDVIVNSLLRLTEARIRHNAYADACHRGKWQLEAVSLPVSLSEAGRDAIAESERKLAAERPAPCTEKNAKANITELSDYYARDKDILAIQLAGYDSRFGSEPPPAASTTVPAIEGVPVGLGASVAEAQRIFGSTRQPEPYTSAMGERLALYPADGFALYLSTDKQVASIKLTKPFNGSVGSVRIGDPLITLKRLMGKPTKELFPLDENRAYFYPLPDDVTVRFDASEEEGVQSIMLLKTK